MKTAVSIPDDVFQDADRIARRSKKSRSQLYSDALREYVARHSPDEITETMNRVVNSLDEPIDPFVRSAGRRTLLRNEW